MSEIDQLVKGQDKLEKRIVVLETTGKQRVFTGAAISTNAAATLIFQFSTTTDTSYRIAAEFVSIRTDVVGETSTHERVYRAKNIGGTVTIFNELSSDSEDDVSWNITRSASGTNVNVFVVGAVGKTIKWTMRATVLQVRP